MERNTKNKDVKYTMQINYSNGEALKCKCSSLSVWGNHTQINNLFPIVSRKGLHNQVQFYFALKPSQYWLCETRIWHESYSVHRETSFCFGKPSWLHGFSLAYGYFLWPSRFLNLSMIIPLIIQNDNFFLSLSEKHKVSELKFPSVPNSFLLFISLSHL